jgi:hypothetical protein
MKDDSPIESSAETQAGEQEKWISREEALKLFNISDRTLRYWKESKKIQFKTIRQRSVYSERSVRAQVQKTEKPKKYWRFKSLTELRTIDPPLALLIVAACFLFVNGSEGNSLLAWVFFNWSSVLLIITAFIWYFIRFIIYFYKRFFEKE